MDLTIGLGLGGWTLLIAGALVIGGAALGLGTVQTVAEALVVGIVAGLGGLFASEFIVAARTFEPVWDGLALVPAIVGAVVAGAVANVAIVAVMGGTHANRPMSA